MVFHGINKSHKKYPRFKIYYTHAEIACPSFFHITFFELWTDKCSRNSKKVVKRKVGLKEGWTVMRDKKEIVFLFFLGWFYFLLHVYHLFFVYKYLVIKKREKKKRKGDSLSLHANPRRETAFYSQSTQKATLCLLSCTALLALFQLSFPSLPTACNVILS